MLAEAASLVYNLGSPSRLAAFASYTPHDPGETELVLIGCDEGSNLHFKVMQAFLKHFVGPQDLVLCEYVDAEDTIVSEGKKIQNHDVFWISKLGPLLSSLVETGVTIQGWDKTSLKEKVVEITATDALMSAENVDVLFGQRNRSMVNAIRNAHASKKYRDIYVIAGAAHFCMASDFDPKLVRRLGRDVKKVQDDTYAALKQYKPLVIIPENINEPSQAVEKRFDMKLCAIAIVLVVGICIFNSSY